MSNICLQEIQSIHSPDERASFLSFFPRDWKHVNRRLWLKAALEFPSFTRWIITPQQQQQQQCRDHYSPDSQLDYLLRLRTMRKNSTFMRFSFLLSFFVIYFVTDKLNWHGKCQTVWREKCSLDFSLFWSATSHHYSDATRSLLAALHFLLSFPSSRPHQPRLTHKPVIWRNCLKFCLIRDGEWIISVCSFGARPLSFDQWPLRFLHCLQIILL